MTMSYFLARGSRPDSTFYAQCGKRSKFFFMLLFRSVSFSKQSNYGHTLKKTLQLWKVPQEKFLGKNCLYSILLECSSLLNCTVNADNWPSLKSTTTLNSRCDSWESITTFVTFVCHQTPDPQEYHLSLHLQWKHDIRPGHSSKYISRRSKQKRREHMVLNW